MTQIVREGRQDDIDQYFDFLFAMLVGQQFRIEVPQLQGKELVRSVVAALRDAERQSGAMRRALWNAHSGTVTLYGGGATLAADEAQARVVDLIREEYGVEFTGRWWR